MACRDFFTGTFDCPLCEEETELTATWEPGSKGSRDEPPYGPQMVDLEGCRHAEAYWAGKLDAQDTKAMSLAADGALDDAARDASDAADESREAAYERRRDEC
jgi:hypothetical protein